MKLAMILPLVLLASTPCKAQWDLFPMGQRGYFLDTSQSALQVDMVLIDSAWIDPIGAKHLYNKAEFRSQLLGACAGQILDFLSDMSIGIGTGYILDSLLERNDTVFCFSNYFSTSPFFFLPDASLGQGWTVSSTYSGNDFSDIMITCSAIDQESFFGITDSVKTFTLQAGGGSDQFDGHQFKLSKEHGLLEYVPFLQLLYHPSYVPVRSLRLIGTVTDGVPHGYVQPDFSDYFHLSAGDVLKWQEDVDPAEFTQPNAKYFLRDSILESLVTSDSVVYTFDRVVLYPDSTVSTFSGIQWRFRRSDISGMMGASPNDIAIGGLAFMSPFPLPILWQSSVLRLDTAQDGVTTITSFGFNSVGQADTSSCQFLEIIDWAYERDFDTRAGLDRYCSNFNIGTDCTTLIGSVIDGEAQGDTGSLTTGISEWTVGSLFIYPNPVTNRLFIHVPQGAPWRFALLDALGRQMRAGIYTGTGIAVEGLPKGLYLLRLEREDGSAVSSRFVKE